eukprot:g6045.t1
MTIFLAPGSELTKTLPFVPGLPQLNDVALTFLEEEFGELLPPFQFPEEWAMLSEMDKEELEKVALTPKLVHQILMNIKVNPTKVDVQHSQNCVPKSNVRYRSQSNEDKAIIEQFYHNKPICGGTIVEIGALDGVQFSKSWYFEHALQWKSLLIEANPNNFKRLQKNRPNAINVYSAMCTGETIDFIGSGAFGGIVSTMSKSHASRWIHPREKKVQVPCRRFKELFSNYGIKHVDVFVLDVEGGEFEVLKSMDWSCSVGLWVVELDGLNPVKDNAVRTELQTHGYVPATWDIRDWCTKGRDCTSNENPFVILSVEHDDSVPPRKNMLDVPLLQAWFGEWSFADRVPYDASKGRQKKNVVGITTNVWYYDMLSKYKYVACPKGLGIDTHRTWESLYMGAIPIVLKSSISPVYEGLPVIQLDSWEELNEESLTIPENSSYEKLDLDFWVTKILNVCHADIYPISDHENEQE